MESFDGAPLPTPKHGSRWAIYGGEGFPPSAYVTSGFGRESKGSGQTPRHCRRHRRRCRPRRCQRRLFSSFGFRTKTSASQCSCRLTVGGQRRRGAGRVGADSGKCAFVTSFVGAPQLRLRASRGCGLSQRSSPFAKGFSSHHPPTHAHAHTTGDRLWVRVVSAAPTSFLSRGTGGHGRAWHEHL